MEDAGVAKQVEDLLYQALETEIGGVEVYKTALRCALNEDLKEEWEKYLEQTQNHVEVVSDVIHEMDLDVNAETPGRKVVRPYRTIACSRHGNSVERRTAGSGPTCRL